MDDAALLRCVITNVQSKSYVRRLTIVIFFHRFLRARKFDVLKAKEMLKDTERWRVEFGVDEIIRYVDIPTSLSPCLTYWGKRSFDFKEADEVSNYYPQFYHKTDKVRAPKW